MNVSAWSIRHPVPAILLFGFLTIIGMMSFHALGIQNFPDVELPTITVTASLEGADPAQLETEVARKIEDKIASLGGIEHIRTTLSDGSATIRVEFQIEKNTEVALNEVRNAVDSVRADLPQDMTDPVVSKVTTSGSPIVTYTVASERMDEQALSWFVDNEVGKALLAVKGVGQVARVGGVDREVHVDLDSARMQALGVTAEAISAQLKRVQQDASGGRGDIGGAVQSVRSLGAVDTVGDIAELIIPLADGRRVRLGDLGTVSDSFAERGSSALLDGAPVVAFEVTRIRGASEVAVAQAVQVAVARLETLHPHVRIQEAFNLVDPVLDNYQGSMELLYEGGLLAILVVFWFLRDWRATLIAAVALPLSIIPTFAAMLWLGFSLNILTLLALALVVGILVDDAIVEIENIVRHLRMGKPPFQAAMEAADEIGLAVIATTLTLVAVFLPTAFMGGVPGKFFVQFGITAAVSVVASLMVARLLTPMMAAYFLRAHPEGNHDSLIMTGYLATARWCLDHRKTTAMAAILFFIGSMQLLPLLPKGFVPAADRGLTSIKLELPPGSSLDDTQLAAERARDLIAPMEEILGIFTAVGSTSGQGPMAMGGAKDVRLATLTLRLVHRHDRNRTQAQVERELRERLRALTGVRVAVGAAQSGEKVQVSLASDDPIALAAAAKAVERDLRTLQGVGNVTSGASLQRPEIQIRPDFARAADLGVTTSALAGAVRVATSGDFKVNLPKLNLPQRQIPIRVRLDRALRTDLDAIAQLRVPAKVGSVPLSAVASLSMGSGPAQIDRVDRMRNVSIDVELGGRQLGAVLAEANALPALQDLPPTVSRVEQGDAQRMAELFASFGTAMLIGVLCIYAVLVLLFHDFMQPFSILAALPLSLGGAFLALLLTGNSFSMPSIIGVLMLMGIVTKNSILLVEYAIVARREHGMERRQAILDACHKRARPIVMTTIAMGAGMLPVALGLGAEPSFRAPMAIAVIGGLITSTFLSLLVIPVVFTYVDDLLRLLKRLVPRGGHAAHHPLEPGNPVSSGP
ncbi:MAG: efflux RND transporter permease subunit [Chromatiaceae bacterium]|nr:efflux RND transporter permease subunit [Chromatiaceae bacterium]